MKNWKKVRLYGKNRLKQPVFLLEEIMRTEQDHYNQIKRENYETALMEAYFDIREAETLEEVKTLTGKQDIFAATAGWFGKTRLIDNIVIKAKK